MERLKKIAEGTKNEMISEVLEETQKFLLLGKYNLIHIIMATNVFLHSNDTELANIILCKMHDMWKMDSKNIYRFIKNF